MSDVRADVSMTRVIGLYTLFLFARHDNYISLFVG